MSTTVQPLDNTRDRNLVSKTPGYAQLQEVFSSIQGEGPWVGKRQVFVRFNGCHLRCHYCDTPAQASELPCKMEPFSGAEAPLLIPNPVALTQIVDWVAGYCQQTPHHSVSLTGGEPLLHTSVLKQLLPMLREHLPIYLETSGTQPDKLAEVIAWVDIVSMDIKVPSATHEPWFLDEHRRFIEMSLAGNADIFAKVVVNQDTTVDEMRIVQDLMSPWPTVPVILQPETSLVTGNVEIAQSHLFALVDVLNRALNDVRLIPQTHKMMGLL